MIEKIKRRKENNFTISHAEQHHRRKGKDKNKRKKSNNFFKDMEHTEMLNFNDEYFSGDLTSIREIHKKIEDGEEVKLTNLEIVKKVLYNKKFKNKIGSYQFDDGMILDVLTYYDNKKVFLIRKEVL